MFTETTYLSREVNVDSLSEQADQCRPWSRWEQVGYGTHCRTIPIPCTETGIAERGGRIFSIQQNPQQSYTATIKRPLLTLARSGMGPLNSFAGLYNHYLPFPPTPFTRANPSPQLYHTSRLYSTLIPLTCKT